MTQRPRQRPRIFLKPAKGFVIYDPDTREALPEGGAWRRRTAFYLRRLRQGDVIDATEQAEQASKTKKRASAKEG